MRYRLLTESDKASLVNVFRALKEVKLLYAEFNFLKTTTNVTINLVDFLAQKWNHYLNDLPVKYTKNL